MRLIDADALKEEFGDINMDIYTDEVKEYIDDAPTIEPKRGEWKKVKNVHAWDISGTETWGVKRKCTNCDFRHTFVEDHGHYNFCPYCGADMREESE